MYGKIWCVSVARGCVSFASYLIRISGGWLNESMLFSEVTTLDSVMTFCRALFALFADKYLRSLTPDDTINMKASFAKIGFPGCLACLNCSEWD